MGKVGSSSIYKSLLDVKIPGSIHHLHILSHRKLEASKADHHATNRSFSKQLNNGLAVREYLDRNPDQVAYIITVVREPVSQKISSFFQNMRIRNPDLLTDNGTWDEDRTRHRLEQELEDYDPGTEWNCNWFDADFSPALNIDIYSNAI